MKSYESRISGKVSIVDLRGEIKIAAGDLSLREAIQDLLADGRPHILVNLDRVPFMDTMGLAELVMGRKRAREKGGDLKLLNPTATVRRVLETTRLDNVFDIFDHEVKAIEAF